MEDDGRAAGEHRRQEVGEPRRERARVGVGIGRRHKGQELEERRAKGEELNADQEGKIAAKERLTAELEKLQALKDKL